MKLLTKTIEKTIPKLYANDGKDPKNVKIKVKFFAKGSQNWYITEYNPEERIFFGYVELFASCGELGYISLDELEENSSDRVFGGVERDRYFDTNTTLQQILDGERP